LSLKSSALAVVRRFQSETDAIREAREPLVARMTLFALSGLIAILVAISFLAHIDRVVTSSQGKIVTTSETLKVFQALDTWLIKSIDVREGDQVKEGQLLATLDQTFANADVSQYKLQVASLDENNQPVTPYYKAHCSIDKIAFYGVPEKFRLVPGMSLTADVKFGRRSLAMYLIGAILRGYNEAMREP
jgi:biotin carboxyl carrier protein